MSLLERIASLVGWRGRARMSGRGHAPRPASGLRICRFEEMERRQLLSIAPIHVGVVYFEDNSGQDQAGGDQFIITWAGGAPGTQLTRLVIDTDKQGDGLNIGDVFFDTAPGGLGAFQSAPLVVVQQAGIDAVYASVEDGGTRLVLDFVGFDPGETLVLTVDVDEMGFLGPNAVAEGNEFEGSRLSAHFAADHYYEASGSDMFLDFYDAKLLASGLPLPADDYVPPGDVPRPVYTAGAFLRLVQTPLPVTVAGTVFEDLDLDNQADAGEPGIEGVEIQLWRRDGDTYTPTGLVTHTDASGQYRFENLLPGVYRLVEVQPGGWLSIGATAGRVAGQPRGRTDGPDDITEIELLGGDTSLGNDFAEVRPAGLSGHVYHDANNNGLRDTGEQGIGGVTLRIEYLGPVSSAGGLIEVVTAADGSWMAAGLLPGEYRVSEIQPTGYLDGLDSAGTAGGTAINPGDTIQGIWLGSGQSGTDYDFGELLPSRIRGRVFADRNDNGVFDPGEPLLAGVTLHLYDAAGKLVAVTQTDAAGRYEFAGLAPGVYAVSELQPADYFDGPERVGTAGGTLAPPDSITNIELVSGTDAEDYDFAELEPASLSGYVYEDDNDNGLRDPGEHGIAGVRVMLLDAVGGPTGIWAVTDASGYYRFANLAPATYGLAEVQPEGYLDGRDTPGSAGGQAENPGDLISGIRLAAHHDAVEYNFGELRPATLAGIVYADVNENGIPDAGEAPISGVTITLIDGSTGLVVASTVTGAEGRYQFRDLRPGVYELRQTQPAGYFDGKDRAGTAGGQWDGHDAILAIPLAAGFQAENYDFGEIPPARISGYVFQDGPPLSYREGTLPPDPYTLRDGQRDPGDLPIAGVWLQLGDEFGAPVLGDDGQPLLAVTDASGYYEFANLRPGTYTVMEFQPEGYQDGNDTPGTRGGIALNPSLGAEERQRILDIVSVKTANDAIVLIPLGPGDQATEYNFSEVRVEVQPTPPVPPDEPIPPYLPPEPIPWPPALRPELPPPYSAGPAWGAAQHIPGPEMVIAMPLYGGGMMLPPGYAWHLSVLDGGRPRRHQEDSPGAALLTASLHDAALLWAAEDLRQGTWRLADTQGRPLGTAVFGLRDGLPVAGDFNGDGRSELGIYRQGTWWLDFNGNGRWDEDDLWVQLGRPGDRPVVGDWNGDGKADLGTFGPQWPGDARAIEFEPGLPDAANRRHGPLGPRPKNMPPNPDEATSGVRTAKRTLAGKLRKDLIDHVFQYGSEGDIPVAGDWNGDGISNIGVFREGTWYLDTDGDGRFSASDQVVQYGRPGDIPVVGDWNGDGTSKLGVYRQGQWYLDTNGNRVLDAQDATFRLGGPGDIPVVGDWNGDGTDEVGVYHPGAPDE